MFLHPHFFQEVTMIDRKTITECPLCGSTNIEHILGEHTSLLRGTAYNVPQTICHDCGEVFLGPDSLEVIRSQEVRSKRTRRRTKTSDLVRA